MIAGPMTTSAITIARNQRPTIARPISSLMSFVPASWNRAASRLSRTNDLMSVMPESDSVSWIRLSMRSRCSRVCFSHGVHAAPDRIERDDHQRHDDQREQRQPPIEHEDGDGGAQDHATFCAMEATVPVTTLSIASTSLETRFMISPVFVEVKNLSGMRWRCRTSASRMSRMMPSPT